MEPDQVWLFSKEDHEDKLGSRKAKVEKGIICGNGPTIAWFKDPRTSGRLAIALWLLRQEGRKQRLPQNPFPIKIEQCERYNKIFLNQSGNI